MQMKKAMIRFGLLLAAIGIFIGGFSAYAARADDRVQMIFHEGQRAPVQIKKVRHGKTTWAAYNHDVDFRQPAYNASNMADIALRYVGASGSALGMRHRQWCAEFANMVRRKAGFATSGSNFAREQVANARRVTPQRGAIAVMGRRGGGHTCIVTAVNGNTIQCVSGNNRHRRVGISTFNRSRISTYVLPHLS